MRIAEFLKPDAIVDELHATSKSEILKELSAALAKTTPNVSAQRLATVLEERERVNSTGVGEGSYRADDQNPRSDRHIG